MRSRIADIESIIKPQLKMKVGVWNFSQRKTVDLQNDQKSIFTDY